MAFDFNLQLAQPGDRIDSAVTPLPEDRRKVTLGRLTIKSVAADSAGECVGITFVPTVLPKGVEPSADPLLSARAAPYGVGLHRAVQAAAVAVHRHAQRAEVADAEPPQALGVQVVQVDVLDLLDPGRLQRRGATLLAQAGARQGRAVAAFARLGELVSELGKGSRRRSGAGLGRCRDPIAQSSLSQDRSLNQR